MRRLLALFAVSVPTCSVAVLPSSEVMLNAWKQRAEAARKLNSYHLAGSYQGASIGASGRRETVGTWDVFKDGERFKWEFRIPESDRLILAYDGTRWRNMSIPASLGATDVRGNVLIRPEEDMGGEPKALYTDLAPVYPFTIPQLVENPMRIKTSASLPDEYLARASRLAVSQVGPATEGTYRVELRRSAVGEPDALPQELEIRIVDGEFVPVRVVRRSPPVSGLSNVQEASLLDYRRIGGVLIPSAIKVDVYSEERGAERVHLAEITKGYKVDSVGGKIPEDAFTIAYPPTALVYDQERNKAERVAGVLPQRAPASKPAEHAWPKYWPVYASTAAVAMFALDRVRRKRRRPR